MRLFHNRLPKGEAASSPSALAEHCKDTALYRPASAVEIHATGPFHKTTCGRSALCCNPTFQEHGQRLEYRKTIGPCWTKPGWKMVVVRLRKRPWTERRQVTRNRCAEMLPRAMRVDPGSEFAQRDCPRSRAHVNYAGPT